MGNVVERHSLLKKLRIRSDIKISRIILLALAPIIGETLNRPSNPLGGDRGYRTFFHDKLVAVQVLSNRPRRGFYLA